MSTNLKLVPLSILPFINKDKWENAQVYDIKEQKGMTDYIDFIKSTDFPENCNLMYGNDCYRRFFLSHHYTDNNNNYVMTMFQRYTDDPDFYVNGGNSLASCHVQTSNFSSKYKKINKYHQHFFDLINNQSIDITDDNDKTFKYMSV